MLRTHGLSGLRRLGWRSPLTGSRRANSSSGNGNHKSNPYASWPPPVRRGGKVGISPSLPPARHISIILHPPLSFSPLSPLSLILVLPSLSISMVATQCFYSDT